MQGSSSANLASIGRDREGGDARLAQQKSDPSLRARDGGRSPGFDRALAAPTTFGTRFDVSIALRS